MDDLDTIIIAGEERRLGSLPPPAGFVSTFNVWEEERPVYDDDTLREIVTTMGRRKARETFGAEWITNQKSHGSCNGYAGAAALSRTRWLVGIKDKLILSGAYLYSKMNRGQDRGSILEDGLEAVVKWGCPPESLVPWDQIYPQQQPKNADAEAAKHKAKKFEAYAARSLQGYKTGLALGYPGISAVHVGSNYSKLKGGICGVDRGPGNHATCNDDLIWDAQRGLFLFDNPGSWGLNWGEQGRGYHTEAHYKETFGIHVFYLIAQIQEAE